jgi:histone H3/H4
VLPTARRWTGLSLRARDITTVQGAAALIDDLGADLDRNLQHELRPAERLRLLRETTNRITRVANDAIQAYQRASRAAASELTKPRGNVAAAMEARVILDAGRSEILRALTAAQRRYPSDVDSDLPASDDTLTSRVAPHPPSSA